MRAKIKFNDDNVMLLELSYKNGKVMYQLIWNGNVNYRFHMIGLKGGCYNPERVDRAHREFLGSKRLRGLMLKSSAAQHQWAYKKRLEEAFDYRERMSRVTPN